MQLNDGTDVPKRLLGKAIFQIADHFKGVSFETTNIIGHWIHEGTAYQDNLARVIADVPDTLKNRKWMKKFKADWKQRLNQLELWMVSYRIEVE